MILSRIFQEKTAGFYVDIGAHHPTRFSNTYLFYLKGWAGINIDAMPGSMNDFRRVRPRDCNIEALVSSEPGTRTFYLFNEPAMNTCDDALARVRNGLAHFRLTGTKAIETKALGALLDKHLASGQKIDFMSIDVEGLDMDVLRSNDWDKFVPTIILTEEYGVASVEAAAKSPTALFLKERGYVLSAKTVNTLFFKQQNALITDDPLPQSRSNGHT